ncbi:MAG: hypothetical protein ABW154_06045 [Dyella sp.]
MTKRKLVTWFVDWTHAWNCEFHYAIEKKVSAAYQKYHPGGLNTQEETEQRFNEMRAFYYKRMVATSSLLIAGFFHGRGGVGALCISGRFDALICHGIAVQFLLADFIACQRVNTFHRHTSASQICGETRLTQTK